MSEKAQDPVCGMMVDPRDAPSVVHEGETYSFCCEGCRRKFADEHGISLEEAESGSERRPWRFLRNKTFIVTAVLLALVGLSYLVPVLEPFRRSFFEYLRTIWWAILLGLFLGGVIDRFVPREYVVHLLARPRRSTVFYAVGLGFLMSACSHGILALGIQLHKKGASTSAVVAFLLASPWANLPLTLMLFGFFGVKGIFIIVSALFVGIVTGLVYQALERRGLVERQKESPERDASFSILEDAKKRVRGHEFSARQVREDLAGIWDGAVSLGNMVLWWILIGMGIASLAGAYIPTEIFHRYLGPSVLGLFVTLGFATIIEVCSEGSAPMAFEIFRQTGALGNSYVFLMAGVATDYTEIGLLWHNVGRRAAIWLPIVTVPQVLVLGWLANVFL